MTKISYKSLIFITLFAFTSQYLQAQITSNADASTTTKYTSGISQDQIFIFCASQGDAKGLLTANSPLSGTIDYEWQKYNSANGNFQVYSSQTNGGSSNTISSLSDGAYRVIISNGIDTKQYTAWIFNNYYEVSATISDSDCDHFALTGSYESADLFYYDLGNNQKIELSPNIEKSWIVNGKQIEAILSPEIYDPPVEDTDYTLSITDEFGCNGETTVTYSSIVTEANFSVSTQSGEAPLEVTFNNESVNGTSGEYEWFVYKDIDIIDKEIEENGESDSIDFITYDDDLTYTFENSGNYMMKLVSKHVSDSYTCTDTFYLDGYISVDTSFISAPNFFTPNGDGANDEFIIKFWSVESIKISIFNRWGKKVHAWRGSDVQGFDNTVSSFTESVWNGKIGGKMASPGVYFYVVEAKGRDNKTRRAHGFVHLFRGK